MGKVLLLLALISLSVFAGESAKAQSLDEAIDGISRHMLTDHPLIPPKNNLAVMQFTPARGQARELGNYLMRKIRIRMFDLDKQRKVRFVSQGKVTNLLVKQGLKNLEVVYDTNQRVELGNLLTADHFVYGTYEVFMNGKAEIVAYLVEVKTGVTLSQSVQKVSAVPGDLMSTKTGAQAPTGYAYSASAKILKSDPKAAKKYRMARIFKERNRPKKARSILTDILNQYPDSVEAMQALLDIMTEDLAPLVAAKRFDQGYYSAVAGLPARYKRGSKYRKLHSQAVQWLLDLGELALSEKGELDTAKRHFDRAKKLGLTDRQTSSVEEKISQRSKAMADRQRAELIREKIRMGLMDDAELMLVEWEAEEPDSPHLSQLKSEFERPAEMVTIPAGTVAGERVRSFNMDKCHVTNAGYLEFVKAKPEYRKSRLRPQLNDKDYLQRWHDDLEFSARYNKLPVVFVSQRLAKAYCEWRGKRLPSSAEWSLAAGEGRRVYPWGDKEPNDEIANFNKSMFGSPLPCESHPRGKTKDGVYHMAGNVWDLTSTVHNNGKSVARGGSYFDPANILKNDNRKSTEDRPTYSSRFMSFRCAK